MCMEQRRKQHRLQQYDYSTGGAYFITICTKDRKNLFWQVGASIARPDEIRLSEIGEIVNRSICAIPSHYPQVTVDHYVVMPNHVHILLQIHDDFGRAMLAPTISRIVQQMKGYVTKQAGFSLWQKLYYDEVIRNESHYLHCWNYIEGNPSKWLEDEYYQT